MTTIRVALAALFISVGIATTGIVAGCSDSQQDLPQRKVGQVEPEGARAYHSPDQFPNVVTYCIIGGHRVVLNTREQGMPVIVIPNDESCGAKR